MKYRILIAEDEESQRDIICEILHGAGHETRAVASGTEAVAALREEDFDVLLTDLRMPGMDGLELLRQAKRIRPEMEVIMMTAYAEVDTAVTAMREGASDYLQKAFDKHALLHVLDRTLDRLDLTQQNRQLRALVTQTVSMGNIIGGSPAMQKVFERVNRATRVSSTVMILGASGTGKELIARHIHFSGPRQSKPFVVVNCAAIPENLVESELFGHEKGAFTGADASRPGKFEAADGGTIFLDEIGDMRLESQAKLLRVLQDGIVERVGSAKQRQVDVRVIVATNRNLREAVDEGEFREDLYFRLEVLPITLPPLRERLQDLPLLISHFREKLGKKLGLKPPQLAPDVVETFRRYPWPGNVRELEHTLEQLYILTDGDTVTLDDLPEKLRDRQPGGDIHTLPPGGVILEDLEQDLIRQALDRTNGSIKDAAPLLGLTYKTLQYRLKKHDIDRKNPEGE